ncbi:hypothetical protein AC1031_002116 [Aphanomyces cochlioides]|nr:hypothetical protein AC1031_002116 [Aphanomyces cochlioides]
MAENAGHQVWYSPPYHSNLQPIELVWALVKNEISRQDNHMTTFELVGKRLDVAMANLTSHAIFGCIRKSERDLLDLYSHITSIDGDDYLEESESDDEGNKDDSDSSDSSDGTSLTDD